MGILALNFIFGRTFSDKVWQTKIGGRWQ